MFATQPVINLDLAVPSVILTEHVQLYSSDRLIGSFEAIEIINGVTISTVDTAAVKLKRGTLDLTKVKELRLDDPLSGHDLKLVTDSLILGDFKITSWAASSCTPAVLLITYLTGTIAI